MLATLYLILAALAGTLFSGSRRRGEKVQRTRRGHNHRQEHEAGSREVSRFDICHFLSSLSRDHLPSSALWVRT
jgi:hypothetical protein